MQRQCKTVLCMFLVRQAVELRERREREHRQEEENNQTDILNHLQGELLSGNTQQSARARRDCYKGMTPEQIREFTDCQRQQAEEKRVN